jgi:hypothetical protein
MSDAVVLERSYRRWLRCYPRAFRREHEAEMLTVLMSGAANRQRRPRAAERIDLLTGAIATRLRPRVPRTNRLVYTVVKLLYIGALLEVATAITLMATIGQVRANVVADDPALTAAGWHAVVAGQIAPLAVSAGIAAVFLLWLAWAYGRGKRWPGIAFAMFFAATTFSLLQGLSRGSFVYAQADLAIASMLWLAELAAVVLVVHRAWQQIGVARSRPARAGTG